MAANQIIAIILIILGTLGLAYGSFSYTKEKHEAKIGPLQFSITEKETINIPVWAGAGAIAAGVILLVAGRKRKLSGILSTHHSGAVPPVRVLVRL
jgi:hypothetical protein